MEARLKVLALMAMAASMTGCVAYHDVKEVKMIGFSQDVSRGKSTGQFESDDCVFKVLGYSLGSYPDVSKAIANARTGKSSKVTDVVGVENEGGKEIRYATNIEASHGGFDAYVFGKHCIKVKGMGYL